MVRSKLVPSFLTITVAPVTSAPDGSVTIPRIVLWVAWPCTRSAGATKRPRAVSKKQNFEKFFIPYLLGNLTKPSSLNVKTETDIEPFILVSRLRQEHDQSIS